MLVEIDDAVAAKEESRKAVDGITGLTAAEVDGIVEEEL